MTLYRVLRPAPLTERTGEVTYDGDQQIRWHRVTTWPQLGTIDARDEFEAVKIARETFGGRPVIELAAEPRVIQDL